jgi:uncharacterized OB-fold protein
VIDVSELTQGVYPPALQQSFADDRTQPFWDAAREGRVAAPECDACGTFVLPPKPYCFECQGQSFTWTDLPGTGTIYTFTVVRHPLNPKLKEVVPYVAGVIELDGTQGAGARLLGNITGVDPERVRIGDPVEVDFTPIGDDYAVMRFRHLGSAAG